MIFSSILFCSPKGQNFIFFCKFNKFNKLDKLKFQQVRQVKKNSSFDSSCHQNRHDESPCPPGTIEGRPRPTYPSRGMQPTRYRSTSKSRPIMWFELTADTPARFGDNYSQVTTIRVDFLQQENNNCIKRTGITKNKKQKTPQL